jgi:hypothetical protein
MHMTIDGRRVVEVARSADEVAVTAIASSPNMKLLVAGFAMTPVVVLGVVLLVLDIGPTGVGVALIVVGALSESAVFTLFGVSAKPKRVQFSAVGDRFEVTPLGRTTAASPMAAPQAAVRSVRVGPAAAGDAGDPMTPASAARLRPAAGDALLIELESGETTAFFAGQPRKQLDLIASAVNEAIEERRAANTVA